MLDFRKTLGKREFREFFLTMLRKRKFPPFSSACVILSGLLLCCNFVWTIDVPDRFCVVKLTFRSKPVLLKDFGNILKASLLQQPPQNFKQGHHTEKHSCIRPCSLKEQNFQGFPGTDGPAHWLVSMYLLSVIYSLEEIARRNTKPGEGVNRDMWLLNKDPQCPSKIGLQAYKLHPEFSDYYS